eukprot:TRINITY_DN2998_c0_g1_i19.p1 TRINITY_DN2998_c0_g1~~TRINITY_DN2998_c0_g1_i19.p1  ORF type:complete len:147 (+),score=13.06 TRINITY_DN2998_c0_g1_i19:1249-1689(+)
MGFMHARNADLAIVLGSSMNTAPFSDMPICTKKMVLVNLGRTSYDRKALVFRTECDTFMRELVKIFGISIPPFTYIQKFSVKWNTQDGENWKVVDQVYAPCVRGWLMGVVGGCKIQVMTSPLFFLPKLFLIVIVLFPSDYHRSRYK